MLTDGMTLRRQSGPLYVALLLATNCVGCFGPQPHHVRGISVAEIRVLEHGDLKRLRLATATHDYGMSGFATRLTSDVPTTQDTKALRRFLEEPRPYRRRTDLLKALGPITRSKSFPSEWRSLLWWIIGTDPLIIGVGAPQGTHVPLHDERTRYPLIGPADLDAPVHHLIIFENGTWPALSKAKDPEDIERIPHRLVPLPKPLSLREIFEGAEELRRGTSKRGGKMGGE